MEFKRFLIKIDAQVPAGLEVLLGCDNYGTHNSPTIAKWRQVHPRFHMHFTPTDILWMHQVERLFAYVTRHRRPSAAQRPP